MILSSSSDKPKKSKQFLKALGIFFKLLFFDVFDNFLFLNKKFVKYFKVAHHPALLIFQKKTDLPTKSKIRWRFHPRSAI